MKFNLIKWKLMLTTLPITIGVVVLKLIIVEQLHYEGIVKFSEIGLVVTGGVFLIGFMLAGTISDYKESEKIPAELACAIETIEDTITLAHALKGGFDLHDTRRRLHEGTIAILGWFNKTVSTDIVFQKIKDFTEIALTLERANVGAIASRVTGAQHDLRKLFSRVNVIRRTNFLATGYAFLEVMTVVIIGLLLLAQFDSKVISIIIISFVTQIFIYMIRLIRDIDEPFEYSPTGEEGAADIDLFPLVEYATRAKQRLENTVNDNLAA